MYKSDCSLVTRTTVNVKSTELAMFAMERCVKSCSSLVLPKSRSGWLGGGLAAVLVSWYVLRKSYQKLQVRRNAKKIKSKRADLAARKRRLENR